MKKSLFIFVITFISWVHLSAQDNEVNKQIWSDVNYRSFIGLKTFILGDVNFRKQLNNPKWNQIILRPQIQHNINSKWGLLAGVGYFNTFYPNVNFTDEIRVFQGVKINLPLNRFIEARNYFRFEQRFFNNDENPSLRIRNQLRVNLIVYEKGTRRISIPVSGEFFFDSSDSETINRSRARFFSGIDYRHKKYRVAILYNLQGLDNYLEQISNPSEVMYRVRFYYYFKQSSYFTKNGE